MGETVNDQALADRDRNPLQRHSTQDLAFVLASRSYRFEREKSQSHGGGRPLLTFCKPEFAS